MRKKMVLEEENEKDQRSRNEQMLDQDRLNEDQIELQETVVSKNLCSAMVRSVRANCDDTMKRSVELLQNQNGTEEFILFKWDYVLAKVKSIMYYFWTNHFI